MLITSTKTMILIIFSSRGRPHREVSFRRRRCSLSFMISLKSATGLSHSVQVHTSCRLDAVTEAEWHD
jgi:hypothetical protein